MHMNQLIEKRDAGIELTPEEENQLAYMEACFPSFDILSYDRGEELVAHPRVDEWSKSVSEAHVHIDADSGLARRTYVLSDGSKLTIHRDGQEGCYVTYE